MAQMRSHGLVAVQTTGILQCLVVVHETTNEHAVHDSLLLYFELEVTHHEVREVIARHLEEQLVLVDGVGLVGNDEEEVGVSLSRQRVGRR